MSTPTIPPLDLAVNNPAYYVPIIHQDEARAELDALRARAKACDEARAVIQELVDAFHDYEMDAEHAAPVGHREMMRRAKAFLNLNPEFEGGGA